MYIIMVNYKQPLIIVDKYLADHRSFLDKYYATGNLICSGSRNPRVGGIVFARADDRKTVDKIIAEDPFYKNGIADYEVIEFNPVKFAPDFETFIR